MLLSLRDSAINDCMYDSWTLNLYSLTCIPVCLYCTSLPIQRATRGVSATVGGNRMGDAALCTAYASAKTPTCSLVALTVMPT